MNPGIKHHASYQRKRRNNIVCICKRCRAEARMKTEIREKEDAGLMEAWSHAQYAGETEREKHTENLISK